MTHSKIQTNPGRHLQPYGGSCATYHLLRRSTRQLSSPGENKSRVSVWAVTA